MFIIYSRLGRTYFDAHQEKAAVDFLFACSGFARLEFNSQMLS